MVTHWGASSWIRGGYNREAAALPLAGSARGEVADVTVHSQPRVSPEACPALVLNADFRPLSYYPLSLWAWQDFDQGGVPRPGEYRFQLRKDRPKSELRDAAPLGGFAQTLCKTFPPSRLHPFQCLSPRPLQLPILRLPRGSDLRPSRSPLEGRHHDLEKCRRRLFQLQSAQGRSAARRGPHVAGADALSTTVNDLHQNGRRFPPNYLHESWMDYLYWDSVLEPQVRFGRSAFGRMITTLRSCSMLGINFDQPDILQHFRSHG